MTAPADDAPILLFDGTCGLCHGFVQFLLKRDRKGTMRLTTLEGPIGIAILARHPVAKGVDSVVWVDRQADGRTGGQEDGQAVRRTGGQESVSVKSDAALAAFRYLGMPWSLLSWSRMVPRFIRDRVYDFVARNRYQWFGRFDSCPLPSAEDRARYL
jgi:predicted DCC family thiol-disulfide oxidoreductase YuxK